MWVKITQDWRGHLSGEVKKLPMAEAMEGLEEGWAVMVPRPIERAVKQTPETR